MIAAACRTAQIRRSSMHARGSSDRVFLRFVASRARSRRLEDIRPAIQHRHHVVAVTHVGNAENPRFFGDIKPTVV